MKKPILLLAALAFSLAAMAVPAKQIWRTAKQADGTRLELSLVGDERLHFLSTRDGVPVVEGADGSYRYAIVSGQQIAASRLLAHEAAERTAEELSFLAQEQPKAQIQRLAAQRAASRKPRRLPASGGPFVGKKKAPVLLVSFSDKSFATSDDATREFYDRVLNEQGFSDYGAPGSVHDYFSDMSRGTFDLSFDLIGPVRVGKSATYYGGPTYNDGTAHIGEFISEAVHKADSLYDIDWAQYDWNADGEVEQVFVLYAGFGQATGGPTGTIWPNAWTLDEALQNADGSGAISLRGTIVNQYACSNELYGKSGKTYMGLGVFCHEFSHCMGLPDMYDTNYGSTPTMGDWDLLASGSYNGPNGIGWCPAGWTSFERNMAGWLNLTELQPGDTIRGMKDLQETDAQAYAIYNDGNRNEYYLLENHTQNRWDAYTPESGLLIIHVDYDSLLFANNIVNTKGTFTPAEGYSAYLTNDHARMAPFSKVRSINSGTYYYTFPMQSTRICVDSLTDNGKPAAELYNANTDGSLLMHKPVYNIEKDASGDISFVFMPQAGGDTPTGISAPGSTPAAALRRVYTAEGRLAATLGPSEPLQLPAGLYIVRQEGQPVRKVWIR